MKFEIRVALRRQRTREEGIHSNRLPDSIILMTIIIII